MVKECIKTAVFKILKFHLSPENCITSLPLLYLSNHADKWVSQNGA